MSLVNVKDETFVRTPRNLKFSFSLPSTRKQKKDNHTFLFSNYGSASVDVSSHCGESMLDMAESFSRFSVKLSFFWIFVILCKLFLSKNCSENDKREKY